MSIQERSFIRDIKSLFKKRQYRILIEHVEKNISYGDTHLFQGCSVFEMLMLQSEACNSLINKHFIAKFEDSSENIRTLFKINLRNIRFCSQIIQKEMNSKVHYSLESNLRVKGFGKISNSKMKKYMSLFVSVVLETFYHLYFSLSQNYRQQFVENTQKQIDGILKEAQVLTYYTVPLHLKISEIYMIFTEENRRLNNFHRAQNCFSSSMISLHYASSILKRKNLGEENCCKKMSCIVLLILLLFTLIRLDIENQQFDQIIGLLSILKSLSFIKLPPLWKKYLKQMILNIQILKIKHDSQLQTICIPLLRHNFPFLTQLISIHQENNRSKNYIYSQISHKKQTPTPQTIEKIKRMESINENQQNINSRCQRTSKDKTSEKRKLKRVLFHTQKIQNDDLNPLVFQQCSKEKDSNKSQIFNKTYSTLPFKHTSQLNKKKCLIIKRSQSNCKKWPKNKISNHSLKVYENLPFDSDDSHQYRKQFHEIKTNLIKKKQSCYILTSSQVRKKPIDAYVRQRILEDTNFDEQQGLLCNQSIRMTNRSRKKRINAKDCLENFLQLLRKNKIYKGQGGGSMKLKLEAYFEKIDMIKNKKKRLVQQKQNGISIRVNSIQNKKIGIISCSSIKSIYRNKDTIDDTKKGKIIDAAHLRSNEANKLIISSIKNSRKNIRKIGTKKQLFGFDQLV